MYHLCYYLFSIVLCMFLFFFSGSAFGAFWVQGVTKIPLIINVKFHIEQFYPKVIKKNIAFFKSIREPMPKEGRGEVLVRSITEEGWTVWPTTSLGNVKIQHININIQTNMKTHCFLISDC